MIKRLAQSASSCIWKESYLKLLRGFLYTRNETPFLISAIKETKNIDSAQHAKTGEIRKTFTREQMKNRSKFSTIYDRQIYGLLKSLEPEIRRLRASKGSMKELKTIFDQLRVECDKVRKEKKEANVIMAILKPMSNILVYLMTEGEKYGNEEADYILETMQEFKEAGVS